MATGSIQFPELSVKPSAPPVNTAIIYFRTDNILYIQDSAGTEVALGTTDSITSLTGDVTAVGPGAAAATVAFVGGQAATVVAAATVEVGAATNADTPNALVRRDASGNFSSNIITATLNGNAATATTSISTISFTGTLNGDVTGTQSATVVASVGGSSAVNIHAAELAANAATNADTPNAIVKRDSSGNFAATTITSNLIGNVTGNVTGNVSGTSSNVTGIVAIANGGTNSSTSLVNNRIMQSSVGSIVEAAAITANRALISDANGIPTQSVTTNIELSYVSGVTSSIQTQLNSISGSGITSLTGDVTAVGPGAAAALIAAIQGNPVTGTTGTGNVVFSASPTLTGILNGASAIFSSTISASNLTGTNTGDVTLAAVGVTPNANGASLSGQVLTLEPADGTHPGLLTSGAQVIGGIKTLSAQLLVNDTTQSTTLSTGSIVTQGGLGVAKNINAGGNINAVGTVTGSNVTGSTSGTNTGDITVSNTNSINLLLAAQALSASLNLSSDAADANNIKATTTIHSGGGAGLHVEFPFAVPVQIGTTNMAGSSSSISLADHVHAITSPIVLGLLLTGYTAGTNTPITAANSFLTAFENLQAQISSTSGSAITALTGDVTATGPGSVASIVNSVGGKTASDIAAATATVDAATSANTPSTLVMRDGSGNFSAGVITANITGNVSGSSASFTGSLAGDVTGTQSATTVSKIQGNTVTGTTGTGNVVFSTSPTVTGTLSAAAITATSVTDSSLTSGSIVFVGASGLLTQDNAKLFWNDSTTSLGIGTNSPQDILHMQANTSAANHRVLLDGYGSGSVGYRTRSAQGTALLPTASQNGNTLGLYGALGYGTSQFAAANTGALAVHADENFTNTSNATYLRFLTTPTASVTALERLRINSTGNILIGSITDNGQLLQVSGQTAITTASTTALTVNTTSFVVDSTNNAIGVGIAPSITAILDAVNSSGSTKAVQLTGYGSNVGIRGRYANGTVGSPTAAVSGNILEFISGRGYGTTGFAAASTGAMNISAGGTFTDTSMPTYLAFNTTPTAAVTSLERLRINTTGNILVGTITDNGTDLVQINGSTNTLSAIISGTAGAGYINYTAQSSAPSTPASGYKQYADSTGRLAWKGTNGFSRTFDGTANTADRVYTLPDTSDQIATAQMTTAFKTSVVALVDAANIATDASKGNTFTVTLGGNRNMSAPSNPIDGQKITYRITQDGTGGRGLTFDAVFTFGLDIISYVPSTGAGKTDYLGCIYNGASSKWNVVAVSKGF